MTSQPRTTAFSVGSEYLIGAIPNLMIRKTYRCGSVLNRESRGYERVKLFLPYHLETNNAANCISRA